jgi:hypothetical protein
MSRMQSADWATSPESFNGSPERIERVHMVRKAPSPNTGCRVHRFFRLAGQRESRIEEGLRRSDYVHALIAIPSNCKVSRPIGCRCPSLADLMVVCDNER